jgi:hypothetical protein
MTYSVLRIFILLPLLISAKCDRAIKFDPDWHVGDSLQESIVNERNEVVMCFEPAFNDFSCMHKNKVCELVKILQNAGASKTQIKKSLPDVDCFK